MGAYRFITEEETKRMKEVRTDQNINDLLKKALEYNDTLLIEENYRYRRKKGYRGRLLGEKEKYFEYQVYHESRALDGSAYQARYQWCGSKPHEVMNYLLGIINGGQGVYSKLDKQVKKGGES